MENCSSNVCLAVVPWVPSQNSSASEPESGFSSQINNIEMMEEEEESSRMEIEDGTDMMEQRNANGSGGMSLSEGVNQWQQQHCLIPQPPQNASAPIVWYR